MGKLQQEVKLKTVAKKLLTKFFNFKYNNHCSPSNIEMTLKYKLALHSKISNAPHKLRLSLILYL